MGIGAALYTGVPLGVVLMFSGCRWAITPMGGRAEALDANG